MRHEHSVFSAELHAIYQCLLHLKRNNFYNAVIFTDSLSSLQLLGTDSASYIVMTKKIKQLVLELNSKGSVLLHWVKAHCGIVGNEAADRAANLGHSNNRSELYDLTYNETLSILRAKFYIYWNDYWRGTVELQGKGTFLAGVEDGINANILSLKIRSRRAEVAIHRLRTGHAGLQHYLARFQMADGDECPACQMAETVEHYLIHCNSFSIQRAVLYSDLRNMGITNPSLKTILGGGGLPPDKRSGVYLALIRYIGDKNKIKRL